MKQLLDCIDILIVALFFLGYLWAVHIKAEEGIFVISILMLFPDAAHDIKTAV